MRVKIGPIKYKIVLVPDLHGGGKKLFGEVHHGSCEVRLEANNAPPTRRQTLWHEILHVVFEQLGSREIDDDEGLVDSMAYVLMQVVQDNKWLAERVK